MVGLVELRESDQAITAAILARSEADGGRLPAERQLAAEIGVTRAAIRHAMAILESEGRVSREVGRGTFVRDSSAAAESASRSASDFAPADVMLVRRLIEPQAMPFVVAWATERDLAEMDRCLADGGHAAGQAEFERADVALHRSIIAASHSPLLITLYAQVEAARHGRVWGDMKRRSASPGRLAEYQSDHAAIVAALRSRDAGGATAAMRQHLARVSRYLLGTDH